MFIHYKISSRNDNFIYISGCHDDFIDAGGNGCDKYKSEKWCNVDGSVGSGWKDEWGPFSKYTNETTGNDVSVCTACGCNDPGIAKPGKQTAAVFPTTIYIRDAFMIFTGCNVIAPEKFGKIGAITFHPAR